MNIVMAAMLSSHGGRSDGRAGVGFGVKILKQSERLFLVVTDGLKMISSPFSTLALTFFSSRRCVKVRPSFLVGAVGLNFWDSLRTIASAALTHW